VTSSVSIDSPPARSSEVEPRLLLGDRLLELRDLAVAQLGGALEVRLALGALRLAVGLLEALAGLLDRLDRRLLVLPARLELGGALVQVGQLGLERGQPLLGGGVLLLAQRLALDLELLDAPVDLVDLGRRRLDLHLQPRGGLVDQVDRLVGQEAVGDVALGQGRRRDDRGVGDAHAVVHLVALLEPAQDRDRVGEVGLVDHDGLEAALERGVLLDVLAVLVERRRADRAQLAARQHRLEQVGGVHRALGGARADDRVQLVDEQDDPALGALHLLEHGLEALLELAAVLRAGEQGADVERDHAPVAQRLGHVARDDALGEALDDRGLADARVADQHRVVLRAPREHLDHAPDLVVAADDRVELAGLGLCGEVAAELLERLRGLLGVEGVGRDVRAHDLVDRLQQRLAVGEKLTGPRVLGQGEQQVLGGDHLAALCGRLALGGLQRGGEALRRPRLGGLAAAHPRQVADRRLDAAVEVVEVDAEPLEDRHREAVGLAEQRKQEVKRGDLRVARTARGLRRVLHGLLRLDREAVLSHGKKLSDFLGILARNLSHPH